MAQLGDIKDGAMVQNLASNQICWRASGALCHFLKLMNFGLDTDPTVRCPPDQLTNLTNATEIVPNLGRTVS